MATKSFQAKRSLPRRHILLAAVGSLLCAGLVVLLPYLAEGGDKYGNDPQTGKSAQPSSLKGLPATDLTQDQAIVHALNRLGYGPRPGDVQRIKEMASRSGLTGNCVPNPSTIRPRKRGFRVFRR